MEKFSNQNFSMMKKYFLSEFFSNIKSLLSAFKRDQLELTGSDHVGTKNIDSFQKLKKKSFWNLTLECSNFFVFQSYKLRFSEESCLILIRSFPVSFVFVCNPGRVLPLVLHYEVQVSMLYMALALTFRHVSIISQKWYTSTMSCTPPWMLPNTKHPEMNELESDKFLLKIWVHNFEKQKI